ncbi:Selenocysteine insertion sequence-binding protein 2-like [Toxocara canis]|uniref:Selenocysteine insertion sequence-binding protein 2-like n=1 Tax=Toxocara canis TaxID=6265 RepID=A0A0B2VG68_TOXCA|nr:Selenocysteine insertion sequence-binding protein 2-like [Toxocara canis]
MRAADEGSSKVASVSRKRANARRSWRPSAMMSLSEFMVAEGSRAECSTAVSRHYSAAPNVKKSVGKTTKKQLSTMKKAILADKSERSNGAIKEEKGDALRTTDGDSNSRCIATGAACLSPLDAAILNLLVKLRFFHDRACKENPVKARSKRRLVCGLREVEKHLSLCNVRCVILAQDLEYVLESGQFDILFPLSLSVSLFLFSKVMRIVLARSKRRLVCGLREVEKHLSLCNVRCVILARDLEYVLESERLGTQVAVIRHLCEQSCVPVLEFSKKHRLGRALKMRPFISAVAVLDCAGAEDLYTAMVNEHRSCERMRHILEHEDQLSLFA